MKTILFFIMLLSNLAMSQVEPKTPEIPAPYLPNLYEAHGQKLWDLRRDKHYFDGSVNNGNTRIQEMIQSYDPASRYQGKFLFPTSSGGMLFNLPPDHMRCLRPGNSNPDGMPVNRSGHLNRPELIPNAIPEVRVLPLQKR